MFRVAEEHAPSIVFIDEIDAVGTKKNIHVHVALIRLGLFNIRSQYHLAANITLHSQARE